MLRYFRRVETRALELGNHRRKYIHGIERHGRLLIDRLEAAGSFDRVHLRRRATDVSYEMDCVLAAGRDVKEKLALLGCYYALQFLLMNVRSIDMLRLNVSERTSEQRTDIYREFLRRTGDDYVRLVREYTRRLLKLFLEGAPRPEFVVCAVGTRIHQDDVDLGIIDDGSPTRVALNRAIGRMATEMMRWASSPDFYLSEHVGEEGYTVSIDEYEQRLDDRILDFVSVTEILGATPLVGSRRVFDEFRERIHERYLFGREGKAHEHEGYLRGLLGEINSLLWWPQDASRINPKHDLLRPVTTILWGLRVIRRVSEPGTWKTLRILRAQMKRHRERLVELDESYTFIETFRHLYQQFAAQEEEIDTQDPGEIENLTQVAEAMGYRDAGAIRAWQHLLVHYHEHVAAGRDAVAELQEDISQHVQRHSVFTELVRERRRLDGRRRQPNLALAILEKRRYFAGIKYWHDLMDALEEPGSTLLAALVRDLDELDTNARRLAIDEFAEWGAETFFTALRLLSTLSRRAGEIEGAQAFFDSLNHGLLARIKGTPDELRRLATVFFHNPALVHEWLTRIDDESRERFHELLDADVHGRELELWRDRLRALSHVHLLASRFFKRVVERVVDKRPEYLLHLAELGHLDHIARGQLAEAMRHHSPATQKDSLGTFYDVEFLRTGLATFRGVRPSEVNEHFSAVSDQYLEMLFDVCKAEVDRERGRRILTHDLIGIFVAGGHARGRAYQDDWDLIIIVNADDDELLAYTNRLVTRLNREIIRRGLMPQYHFADRFGSYVTPLAEIEKLLDDEADAAFVEMSQLLGARMIVGSSRLEELFQERIVEQRIFDKAGSYVRAALRETRSRHVYRAERGGFDSDSDIKECQGGLRDLEMTMLIYKVLDRAPEPIGDRFWDLLVERHPEEAEVFRTLRRAGHFMNRLRDLYRLSVSPVNRLDVREFERPAALLGYGERELLAPGEVLANDFGWHRREVSRSIELLFERVEAALVEEP